MVLNVPDALFFNLQAVGTALEVYHTPRWMQRFMRNICTQWGRKDNLGRTSMDGQVLAHAAEERAVVLRRQLGIMVPSPAPSC